MRLRFLVLVAAAATGSAGAATPAPDPRLEQALNQNVISQINRSTDFDRTIPPLKPPVEPGQGARVAEDVYVDPRLMPSRGGSSTEPAIRVDPRDRR